MAQCPNCSQSIAITDDHFGTLYRCEHCKVEFFIGFDGVPENSKEPLAADMIVAEPAEPLVVSSMNSVSDEPEMPALNSIPDFGMPEVEPSQSQASSSDLFSIQQSQDSATATDSMAMAPDTASSQMPGDAFKSFAEDVQNFGNESSDSGVLSFDIEISGIDLGETKKELLEALEDKRFGWDLTDLTQNIKDGKLTISNISAPKIIVLVKRITPMGLVLNWRHHVATQ